jgi:fructose-specific component phosphotransferase system IIB-like protein
MHKGFSNLSFTLSGRNLWLIKSNVPNIDPESTYSNGNGQGVEYAAYPTARSIGLNIQLSF